MALPAARQAGISLIEQIMVLAIVGTLTALATPALAALLQHTQLQAAQSEFINAMQQARNRAIIGNRTVVFCPSHDGANCLDDTRWETGWLVADPMPRHTGSSHPGLTILGDRGRRRIRFRADGTASGSTNTLRLCRRGRAEGALVVVIANNGRVRGDHASPAQAADCAAAQ